MKTAIFIFISLAGYAFSQDFGYRVRQEVLDQRYPVTVNVSTNASTTLQFPGNIQSLESDGFTTKPSEEVADFCISPGINWVTIRSLRPGAAQNLGIVISGKVYEVFVQTTDHNDFSVLFYLPHPERRIKSYTWSPLKDNK